MKKYFLFIFLLLSLHSNGQGLTAKEIVQKADDKNRGLSSEGEMTMTIIRTDWTRSVSMKSWSKGKDLAMVLITAPAKDKGQVFLKLEERHVELDPIHRQADQDPAFHDVAVVDGLGFHQR